MVNLPLSARYFGTLHDALELKRSAQEHCWLDPSQLRLRSVEDNSAVPHDFDLTKLQRLVRQTFLPH